MDPPTNILCQRAARIRAEQDELIPLIIAALEQSGLLQLIHFGKLNLTVTNDVIQELEITPTFRPNRTAIRRTPTPLPIPEANLNNR